MESGVARKDIEDWDAYRLQLRELMGYESKLTRQLYDTARRNPQRVVFAEGIHPNMLKAAVEAKLKVSAILLYWATTKPSRSWQKN